MGLHILLHVDRTESLFQLSWSLLITHRNTFQPFCFEKTASLLFLKKIELLSFILDAYQTFSIILFSIDGALPPRGFIIGFDWHSAIGWNIFWLKIFVYCFFFSMIVFHQLDQDSYPLILDIVVIASKPPNCFIAIFVILGHKTIIFVSKCLSDVLALHEMATIEVDL